MTSEWDVYKNQDNKDKHPNIWSRFFGEPGGKYMNKSNRYTNAPEEINEALLNAAEIEDFLPPPEQLIRKKLDNYTEHYAQ